MQDSKFSNLLNGIGHFCSTPYMTWASIEMSGVRGSNLRLTYLYKLITMQNYVKTTENRVP